MLCVFSSLKTIRKYLIPLFITISLIIGILFNVNQNIKDHFIHFNNKVINIDFFSTIIIKEKVK